MSDILSAIKELKNGKLIGLPTETVYGLAAPIDNERLIARIFELKKRPFFDPLIVHVATIDQAKSIVEKWYPICDAIAEAFWPGPVTLVLEKKAIVSDLITSGLKTVGVRIPKSSVAIDFITQLGTPVAAPSANLFKKVSPTNAGHVREVFSSDDVFILDDGPCEIGIESTIIKVTDSALEILRPGLICSNELKEITNKFNYSIEYTNNTEIKAPGMLEEHYRPEKPMNVVCARNFEDAVKLLKNSQTFWFSLDSRPEIAARQLYQKMREACQNSATTCSIWIDLELLKRDDWKGILDRLKKAASNYIVE